MNIFTPDLQLIEFLVVNFFTTDLTVALIFEVFDGGTKKNRKRKN